MAEVFRSQICIDKNVPVVLPAFPTKEISELNWLASVPRRKRSEKPLRKPGKAWSAAEKFADLQSIASMNGLNTLPDSNAQGPLKLEDEVEIAAALFDLAKNADAAAQMTAKAGDDELLVPLPNQGSNRKRQRKPAKHLEMFVEDFADPSDDEWDEENEYLLKRRGRSRPPRPASKRQGSQQQNGSMPNSDHQPHPMPPKPISKFKLGPNHIAISHFINWHRHRYPQKSPQLPPYSSLPSRSQPSGWNPPLNIPALAALLPSLQQGSVGGVGISRPQLHQHGHVGASVSPQLTAPGGMPIQPEAAALLKQLLARQGQAPPLQAYRQQQLLQQQVNSNIHPAWGPRPPPQNPHLVQHLSTTIRPPIVVPRMPQNPPSMVHLKSVPLKNSSAQISTPSIPASLSATSSTADLIHTLKNLIAQQTAAGAAGAQHHRKHHQQQQQPPNTNSNNNLNVVPASDSVGVEPNTNDGASGGGARLLQHPSLAALIPALQNVLASQRQQQQQQQQQLERPAQPAHPSSTGPKVNEELLRLMRKTLEARARSDQGANSLKQQDDKSSKGNALVHQEDVTEPPQDAGHALPPPCVGQAGQQQQQQQQHHHQEAVKIEDCEDAEEVVEKVKGDDDVDGGGGFEDEEKPKVVGQGTAPPIGTTPPALEAMRAFLLRHKNNVGRSRSEGEMKATTEKTPEDNVVPAAQ